MANKNYYLTNGIISLINKHLNDNIIYITLDILENFQSSL